MVHLSCIALIIAFCTQGGQWVLDGRKVLVVADPDGLRSRLGAVAVAGGSSTNLTVYDTLDVSSVVISSSVTVSGSDAGDYAGAYSYAGTDSWYGDYFTNALGCTLYPDADWWCAGEWMLGTSLGNGIYGSNGSIWCDCSTPGYDTVDIVMTGTPSVPSSVGGNLHAQGSVTAEGSFIAMAGSATESRYCFGSNSWLYVSETNLMFRNSAGNIGTVNITY